MKAFLRCTQLSGTALACLFTACGPTAAEKAASASDSIVAIADSAGLVFRGMVNGRALELMVHDCKLFDLSDKPDEAGQRPVRIKPDFYPWPTVCSRQSIEADSALVTVVLGRTGLGAGGCCATGGKWRSRDGVTWEREGPGGAWSLVGADSARAP
jgi:hypothetical protein